MPSTIRVAAVQAAPAFLNLPETLDRLEQWVARAAGEGARIVAFPETWLPGYPAWLDSSPEAALWGHDGAKTLFARLVENAVEVPGPTADRLGRAAGTHQVTLVVGLHERAGRSLYNAILTFGPDGTLLNHHRKLVPTYSERLIWGQGDGRGLRVVNTGGARVGSLVCWEHWMPLARQALHDLGEEIHVAQWPGVQEIHQIASRHYAFEGRCFVIAVGSILRVADMPPELPLSVEDTVAPGGLLIRGGSAIIAPNGRYLAGPVFEQETLVLADCDLGEIPRESMTLDVSGHYSRPDVFEFRVRGREPQ
ncbi:MAG: carbon-nitrogen hydrolase family protein [Gemmatimonadales bacterium]